MVLVEWFAVDFSTITLMLLAAVVSLAAFAVGEFGKKKGGDTK